MELVDELVVPRRLGGRHAARIQLLHGDLAAIPHEHAVDALVVSAFPNSYTPDPGTLFESLAWQGLQMQAVAENKEEDERARLGCWLSRPLPPPIAQRLNFDRVICFEPRHPDFLRSSGIDESNIEETVGFVFRCLNNFIIPDDNQARRFAIAKVAMPLLATGNQRVPVDAMLPRLLDAAVFWLEQGLPIDQLKIVVFRHDAVAVAHGIFAAFTAQYQQREAGRATEVSAERPSSRWQDRLAATLSRHVIQECEIQIRESLRRAARPEEQQLLQELFSRMDSRPQETSDASADERHELDPCDIFISYAHTQETEVQHLVDAIRRHAPERKIFFDRTSIPPGGRWLKMLSDALQNTTLFVAVLSPDYSASMVCWDEFQCAKLREYTTRQSVIKTIRLYSERAMPPVMGIYSYIDCAEGDLQRLHAAAAAILQ